MNNENIYIALGSNLGNRKENFNLAIKKLEENGIKYIKSSPLYYTPALLLKGSSDSWNIPYLNCVIQIVTDINPFDLLKICKKIEKEMGRDFSQKWAPRIIDLDILLYKKIKLNTPELTIPHKELFNRYFLIDALSFLDPNIIKDKNIYTKNHLPTFMGIINVTPNSFSDGNIYYKEENFKKIFEKYVNNNVGIIDIGAESTAPNSSKISYQEELNRLKFVFEYLKNRNKTYFDSMLSIDTYHYETAKVAIKYGFNIINDVSGLIDDRFINLLKENKNTYYVLTHSLSIPANKNIYIPENDNVIILIQKWIKNKIKIFEKNKIDLNRIILDFGIGFGKLYFQNLKLLSNISKFHKYGMKILVGHSRKSFIKAYHTDIVDDNLDFESLSISLKISNKLDIIRTHTPIETQNSLLFFNSIK